MGKSSLSSFSSKDSEGKSSFDSTDDGKDDLLMFTTRKLYVQVKLDMNLRSLIELYGDVPQLFHYELMVCKIMV